MKLLLIGHSVFDTIINGENIKTSPGGIFYTAQQIAHLSSSKDEIFLLTQFDNQTFKYFLPVYSRFDDKLFQRVDAIPSVKLILREGSERKEIYENTSPKLSLENFDYSVFDGILINMITGTDININDLKIIRSQSNALIHFDVHTLSRPMDESGDRIFTVIPDFDDWARNIDILQSNEFEFNTLGRFDNHYERINHFLSLGVKIILITKGSKGAVLFFKKDTELISYFVSAVEIKNADTVGCGDVFGASFFYNYIRNKNVYESLSFAIKETENFLSGKTINAG